MSNAVCVSRRVPAGGTAVVETFDQLVDAQWAVTLRPGRLALLGPASAPPTNGVLRRVDCVATVGWCRFPAQLELAPWSAGVVELLLRPVWRKRVAHIPAVVDRYYDVAHDGLDGLAFDLESRVLLAASGQ